jgi:hyaluronate lyase
MSRSNALRRNAASPSTSRSLRLENLEPRLVLSTGLSSLTSSVKSAAAALTLAPTADAYVSSASPQTNYGQTSDLLLQNSAGPRGTTTAAYLKYDLSSVSGAVSKVVLNLTPTSVTSASSVTLYIQLLKDSNDGWVEGTGGTVKNASSGITWSNSPNGSGMWVTISGSQLRKGSTISIDVTSLIQQSLNANGIASFVIEAIPQGLAETPPLISLPANAPPWRIDPP